MKDSSTITSGLYTSEAGASRKQAQADVVVPDPEAAAAAKAIADNEIINEDD